ncbi:unnamed protein product, partial [Dovyalis caffra]
ILSLKQSTLRERLVDNFFQRVVDNFGRQALMTLTELKKVYAVEAQDEEQRYIAASRAPILKAMTLLAKSQTAYG